MGWMKDETGLEKCAANHVALTPLSHLQRAVQIWPDHDAVVYGESRTSYAEYHKRITQLASAMRKRGIASGDVVATMLPNIPAHAEAHFAVPACGAVINTINIRLDVASVAYILDHGEAKMILVDPQFMSVVEEAITVMEGPAPIVIEVPDVAAGHMASGKYDTYEALLAEGDASEPWILPEDEWESLALNYTSGTTGKPKGVVYHHRGAYLMTMGAVVSWQLKLHPRFLAIVPLFHCNGWNHTWMMPLVGGTVHCVRDVTPALIYDEIADRGVTHFGGAPIVLNMIVNMKDEDRKPFDHLVEVITAGAPPAAATLEAIEKLGFNVTQVYGLTETYGHITESLWKSEWDGKTTAEKAALKARQGVGFPMMEGVTVHDSEGRDIPHDGKAQGEIAIRGNCVMKGYFKNPEATKEAFKGGWFHSGDIAVQHPDNYIQIADRAKDIIISGGENISSVEVEGALMHHPAVSLCAVVAKPDEKWGEVPCAFVELKEGEMVTAEELMKFARKHLAGFKTPKDVRFQELPKTSTGKIQKFELRQLVQ